MGTWKIRYDDGMLGSVDSKTNIQFIYRPVVDTTTSHVDTSVSQSVDDETHVKILDILQEGMLVIDVEADALWEKGS